MNDSAYTKRLPCGHEITLYHQRNAKSGEAKKAHEAICPAYAALRAEDRKRQASLSGTSRKRTPFGKRLHRAMEVLKDRMDTDDVFESVEACETDDDFNRMLEEKSGT